MYQHIWHHKYVLRYHYTRSFDNGNDIHDIIYGTIAAALLLRAFDDTIIIIDITHMYDMH